MQLITKKWSYLLSYWVVCAQTIKYTIKSKISTFRPVSISSKINHKQCTCISSCNLNKRNHVSLWPWLDQLLNHFYCVTDTALSRLLSLFALHLPLTSPHKMFNWGFYLIKNSVTALHLCERMHFHLTFSFSHWLIPPPLP